jgi:hypothetical protein
LERQENAEARADREDRRRASAAAESSRRYQAELSRRASAELAAIRQAPNIPELGATIQEAKILCERQRGQFREDGIVAACRVGGSLIFVCKVDQAHQFNRCDGYYESADLASSRREIERQLGTPPSRERVSSSGYRVFEWSGDKWLILITSYDRGVRMTTIQSAGAANADESDANQ